MDGIKRTNDFEKLSSILARPSLVMQAGNVDIETKRHETPEQQNKSCHVNEMCALLGLCDVSYCQIFPEDKKTQKQSTCEFRSLFCSFESEQQNVS